MIGELLDVYENGSILAKSNLFPLREGESDPSEKKLNPRRDYLKTFDSLYERQPDLCVVLLREFLTLPSIKKASAELNLQYERNEASAVKVSYFSRRFPLCLTKWTDFPCYGC